MRFALFSTPSTAPRLGIADGASVRGLGEVSSLEQWLAMEEGARNGALARLSDPIPLEDVTLHAPVRPHKNVFCIGRNYLAHAEEGARARGEELKLPTVPTIFTKAPTAIADPNATLHLEERLSQKLDWEAELAVVIGRRCKNVSEADALDVIFGYTCLNDISARDLQNATNQWFKGKTLDDTCPIGPWVVEAGDIGDPQRLDVTLLVNGVEKQSAPTSAMIFNIRTIISYLSQGLTLEPGDIIATGTPEGVGFARTPPEFLKYGDVVDVVISKIGTLRNTVSIT